MQTEAGKALNIPKKPVILVGSVFCWIVAMSYDMENLILLALALLLVPYISQIIGIIQARGLRCTALAAPVAYPGAPITVRYAIFNAGLLPLTDLLLLPTVPPYLEVRRIPDSFVSLIGRQETAWVQCVVVPQMRGAFDLGPIQVDGTDILGINVLKRKLPIAETLIVYPVPLNRGRSISSHAGASGWSMAENGRMRGAGGDFFGIREYSHGDDLRNVHWRSTARLNKLVVRESARGDSGDVFVVLDQSRSSRGTQMAGPDSPFEQAVIAAITILDRLFQSGTPCRLILQSTGHDEPALLENLAQAQAVLAMVQQNSDVPLSSLLIQLRGNIRPGATLVMLSTCTAASDALPMLEDLRSADVRAFGVLWPEPGDSHLGCQLPQTFRIADPDEPLSETIDLVLASRNTRL